MMTRRIATVTDSPTRKRLLKSATSVEGAMIPSALISCGKETTIPREGETVVTSPVNLR